ncbi:MAG TPA: hypothetical protein VIY72_12265, partial [Acidimicrobiales bacterium]
MAITSDPLEGATPAPSGSSSGSIWPTTIGWVQWAVAALLVGAGAVHLALAPSHFGEATAEGIGFLVVAWLQIGLAVAVLLKPSRAVVAAIVT